jgi:hypothetical protein
MAKAAQLILHADLVGDGEGFKDQLEDKHGKPKENEEQEETCSGETGSKEALLHDASVQCTFSRSAKPVALAGIWGQFARLDHQNARVHKDEGQMRQCCQRSVVSTAEVQRARTNTVGTFSVACVWNRKALFESEKRTPSAAESGGSGRRSKC